MNFNKFMSIKFNMNLEVGRLKIRWIYDKNRLGAHSTCSAANPKIPNHDSFVNSTNKY